MPKLTVIVTNAYVKCRKRPATAPHASDLDWQAAHLDAMEYMLSLDGLSISPAALHPDFADPEAVDLDNFRPRELWACLSQVVHRVRVADVPRLNRPDGSGYVAALRLKRWHLDLGIAALTAPGPRIGLLFAVPPGEGPEALDRWLRKRDVARLLKDIREA